MAAPFKPVFLLADSQLLFRREADDFALAAVRSCVEAAEPKAAYVGAANGDDPAYFNIFEAGMQNLRIRDCRMVPADPSAEDFAFLEAADVILLAGGSVERGWRAFGRSGLTELLLRRYAGGAVLMGVSAGAVHLGTFGLRDDEGAADPYLATLKIVPYVVGAHEEANDWRELKRVVRAKRVPGLGIPTGGGLVYHPDHTLEPLARPAHEFTPGDAGLVHNLLMPGGHNVVEATDHVC